MSYCLQQRPQLMPQSDCDPVILSYIFSFQRLQYILCFIIFFGGGRYGQEWRCHLSWGHVALYHIEDGSFLPPVDHLPSEEAASVVHVVTHSRGSSRGYSRKVCHIGKDRPSGSTLRWLYFAACH